MSVLEFIAALVEHLISWPVAAVLIFLMLRKPIKQDLLPRLRSYEGMGQKVTFGDDLANTETSVDAAVEGIPKKQQAVEGDGQLPPALPTTEISSSLARDAEMNPSFAMLSAYERLTDAVAHLAGSRIPPDRSGRGLNSRVWRLAELEKQGVVNGDFVRAVTQLRDLRNRVAHGQHNPTAGEAVAYVESAEELTRAARVLAFLSASTSIDDGEI